MAGIKTDWWGRDKKGVKIKGKVLERVVEIEVGKRPRIREGEMIWAVDGGGGEWIYMQD